MFHVFSFPPAVYVGTLNTLLGSQVFYQSIITIAGGTSSHLFLTTSMGRGPNSILDILIAYRNVKYFTKNLI